MFVDEAIITHQSRRRPGERCVSFRREKYIPKADRWRGWRQRRVGHLCLRCPQGHRCSISPASITGSRTRRNRGWARRCYGKAGKDLYIHVPPGTLVFDRDHGILLADLNTPEKELVICKGGKGGLGTSISAVQPTSPRYAEPASKAKNEVSSSS